MFRRSVTETPCDVDVQAECAGNEDEAFCPYTTDRSGVGLLSIGDNCYRLSALRSITWAEADGECVLHGGRLASLTTLDDWYYVERSLGHLFHPRFALYIGLRVASPDKPSL